MTTYIIFDAPFNEADLPSSLTYDERLAGQSSLLQWLVPDEERVTLVGGRISVVADRASAAHAASQGAAGNRPLWVSNGAPSGREGETRPALTFDSARADILSTGVVVPTGSAAKWSKVCLVKPPAETVANTFHDLMSGNALSSSSLGIHRLAVRGVNTFHNRVGTTTNLAQASVAMTPDAWQLVIATWDGTTNTARISVNGGAWVVSTVAGAQCDNAVLSIGGVSTGNFSGLIADAMVWAIDLSASSNADLLAVVKQYYRDRYGVTVA